MMHTLSGRTVAVAAAVILAAMASSSASANETEILQRAADSAIAQAAASLERTHFPQVQNIAVVPMRGDGQEYATSGLASAVTKTSYKLFSRSDEEWNKLLGEIEWGVRREDVMNPETVKKFGRIEGVDAVLFGRVWDSEVNMWAIRARTKLSVYLADVETGQILWSSGPVEGEAYMHWSNAVTQFWRYPLLLIGALVALVIVLMVIRKTVKAIRHAARPL